MCRRKYCAVSLPNSMGADAASVQPLLMVEPRAEHEEQVGVIARLRLERFIKRDVAVDVFLIPEAMHQHRGHRDPSGREELIEGLILPERIVRRMAHDLAGKGDLIETVQMRHVARGSRG